MASEDMDSLTFGAPRFLRHLMDPSSRKVPVMEFEIAKVLTTSKSDIIACQKCCSSIGTSWCFQRRCQGSSPSSPPL